MRLLFPSQQALRRGDVAIRLASALLTVSLLALGLAACKSDPPAVELTCEPVCAAGFRCDTTVGVCVLGDARDASIPDAAVLSGTCKPACAAPTPQCNAKNQCVACLSDDHCEKGSICKPRRASSLERSSNLAQSLAVISTTAGSSNG